MRFIALLFTALLSLSTFADLISDFVAKVEIKEYSPVELAIEATNYGIPLGQIVAPISDYHPVGFIAFNGSTPYDSLMMKMALVQNMPADVPIVVYGPKRELKDTQDTLPARTGDGTVKFVRIEDPLDRQFGYEEWTADHLGYPVWIKAHGPQPRIGLMQAEYRWGYDPNPEFSRLMLAPVFYKSADFIEFGNMVINAARKTAYVVQSPRLRNVPSEIYLATGVNRVVRLPHLTRMDQAGKPYAVSIGHADERMLFLSDTVAVVDSPEFEAFLKKEGYDVRMLPSFTSKDHQYRSYVNARLVNGVAFVPVFNDPMDAQALKVYEDAGFKAVPILAPMTSDIGRGNVHCMTRMFPALPNGEKYQFLDWSLEDGY